MAQARSYSVDVTLLLLRLALGPILSLHGAQKLGLLDAAPSWATTQASIHAFAATTLAPLGLEPAMALAWATALTESFAGLFVLLGLATRLAAVASGCIMLVAIAKVHSAHFFVRDQGFEYPLLILAVCLGLLAGGAGRISLDNLVTAGRGAGAPDKGSS